MAKITLYIDDADLLATAKAYAQAHQTSVSKLVADYFRTLQPTVAYEPDHNFFTRLHAQLQAQGWHEPTDEEDAATRAATLEEKYA
jgi:hypothetical protein